MILTHTIDWLTFTVEGRRGLDGLHMLADELFRGATTFMCKANHGYKLAVRTREGIIIQSGARPDMHTNVSCSGAALSEYSSIWRDWEEHLKELLARARNVSRIDLALDLRGTDCLDDIVALTRAGAYTCPARTFKVIESNDRGRTLYLGERSSERMMRIYDKAAQTGDTAQSWTRLELEVKGEAAKRCAKAIQDYGLYNVCRGWIVAFADFDIAVWHSLKVRTLSTYSPSQRKHGDTRRWILETIAPIMANLIASGETGLLDEFVVAVKSFD